MTFQIKNFQSIVASQINHARAVTEKITDFLPGSVARTLMEAPAVEIEELYMQMLLGLRDAIPVATYLSFDFDRLAAAVARGWVTVSKSPAPSVNIEIPAGTPFTTQDGRIYASSEAVVWLAGVASVRVPVAYSAAGSEGNVAGGAITASPLFGPEYTITNALIDSGRDDETPAEREARFSDFVASLSRGTMTACLYAASRAKVLDVNGNISEYVARIGHTETPGYVRIFVYSNLGSPSAELIESGQILIDGKRDEATGDVIDAGYRAAGVRVDVARMIERAVPMTISVSMLPGQLLTNEVRGRLEDVYSRAIRGVAAGQTLFLGTLIEMLLAVPGVLRVVPNVSEHIVCGVHEALIPGTLNIASL